ncbi:thiosulfate:glutathione sulfurtransferase-like [Rhinichthys klamathensis goyatoka]|uniref:thiosulfate:glutathione sulfurtransferase-like n=1 Tax=Rhinichthys klamathensis goyatoka TaxID=3034132 RepID=UPI0024B5095A|nr:thiosulfate:glutathione sulfurtransferase-like [Rhinichthys klamathensis goyatoka]
MKSNRNCIIDGSVGPICELERVQGRGNNVFDMLQDYPFKALHDDRSQCDWTIVMGLISLELIVDTHASCVSDGVVTYEQLKLMMSTGSVQLVDVREPHELEAGFIPGATNIPLGEVEQALRLSPDQFRELYGVTKPHKEDSDFVLYCVRGIRSLTALETARALGYTRARHYAGGFSEWLQREDL